MRKPVATLVIALFALSVYAPAAQSSEFDTTICPPYVGTFNAGETGLTVTIVKEHDQSVRPHTERLANPPSGKDAEAAVARGRVQFNAHIDKESGRLFVHWDSLRTAD